MVSNEVHELSCCFNASRSVTSQTLIVLSLEPETILLPSLLKATEKIRSLCALCFSALSSKDPVASTGETQLWVG